MGFWGSAANRVRGLLKWDKDRVAITLAKGNTASTAPGSGFDLLQSYGHDQLQDYLRIENDLMARYVDAEQMDEFPETSCIVNSTIIPTPSGPDNKLSIKELMEIRERDPNFKLYVYTLDHESKRVKVALASGPKKTGDKQAVYKVTFEEYRSTGETWSITATGSHLFMLRDGSYRKVLDLEAGDRLMPCTFQHNSTTGYLTVYEPLITTPAKGARYNYVHKITMEAVVGRSLVNAEVVHHKDRNKKNPFVGNLELTTLREHVAEHVNNKEDEAKRIAKVSAGLVKKWSDQKFRHRVALAQRSDQVTWLAKDRQRYIDKDQGIISQAHREAISRSCKIPLAKDVIEATLRSAASLKQAAERMGVSWMTIYRRMDEFGIDRNILGSNLDVPTPGSDGYDNHRITSVEYVGDEDVYDIEVPKYHNFAAGDAGGSYVFIHNSALDIYADDTTQVDALTNKTVWADAPDRTVKEVLTDLFDVRLRLDEEAWSDARTLSKYGQEFNELLVTDDGLVGTNYLPPPTMRRIEGRRGELYGYIQDTKGKFGYQTSEFQALLAQRASMGNTFDQDNHVTALEDWEVVHTRLRGKQKRSLYGTGVLDSGRWIWKRLMLLEDSAMIYELERAPQRYAFYIDTGDMPPKEAFAYLNKVRQQYKKQKFFNPNTNSLDLRQSPLSSSDDFFVSVRKGESATKIDVLNSPKWNSTETLDYFRLKLFAAIKVPMSYLGFADTIGKGALSQQDVRFARTVLRIQRELRNGYARMGRIHLAALNIDPRAIDFEVYMTVPGSVFELAQLEARNAKADFAGRMSQFVSMHWILSKVFGLSDDEVEYIIKQRHEEQLDDAEIQAKAMGLSVTAQGEAQSAIAGQQGPAQPGSPQAESVRQALREMGGLSRLWPQRRQTYGYKPITEQELFHGNRDHEKRIEDNWEKVFKTNTAVTNRLTELRELINELRLARPR